MSHWKPDADSREPAVGQFSVMQVGHDLQQIWRMALDEGEVVLQRPDGNRVVAPRTIHWGLEALEFLSQQDSTAFQISADTRVVIEADVKTHPWLPLFLSPQDDSVEIEVNGEDWYVLGWVSDGCVASPVDDLEECWARFGWSETASRTSGVDYSEIGPVTAKLGMIKTFMDERSCAYSFVPLEDPAAMLDAWLETNKLAEELRQCWPGGEDDLIRSGFRALLKYGRVSMDWDAPDLRPPAWGDDMVGTTSSSEWSFGLTSDEGIRARLMEEFGWAEGITPVPVEHPEEVKEPEVGPPADIIREARYLLSRAHPRDDLQRARSAYEKTLIAEADREVARTAAAERLGLPIDSPRPEVFRRVETLAAEDPAHSPDYWYAAYDLVPPLVDGPESALEVVRQAEARVAALEDQLRDFNWPTSWDERLCPLWVKVGGTSASAHAWANAGWSPVDVLTDLEIPGFPESSLESRVTATEVPDSTRV